MEDEKTVLIADLDHFAQINTKIICREIENIRILTAATHEEAIRIIDREQDLDLVIVDPMWDLHTKSCRGLIDVSEGTFRVMNHAVSKGIKVLIVTTVPEVVDQEMEVIGMKDKCVGIVGKNNRVDGTRDAIVSSLSD